MIVVYDSKGQIQYTVEKPYPQGLIESYATMSDNQADFNFLDNGEATSVGSKYVLVSEETASLEERPELDLSYNSSITTLSDLVISGIPDGASVRIDGEDFSNSVVNEQVLIEAEGTGHDAGVYKIDVDVWPYLPKTIKITVE